MKDGHAYHKKRILFVCSGNACRSQIAEGWARTLAGTYIEAFSAGVEAHGLDPAAVTVMAEVGVDISRHRSKSLGVLPNLDFDCIVTLSDRAAAHIRSLSLPAPVVEWPCESPSRGAFGSVPSMARYRRLRDDLMRAVGLLLKKPALRAS